MLARSIRSVVAGASLFFAAHARAEDRTVLVEEFGATW